MRPRTVRLLALSAAFAIAAGLQTRTAWHDRESGNSIRESEDSRGVGLEALVASERRRIDSLRLRPGPDQPDGADVRAAVRELVLAGGLVGVEIEHVDLEPDASTATLAATGSVTNVVGFLERIDPLLESSGLDAERFSLAADRESRVRLDIRLGPGRTAGPGRTGTGRPPTDARMIVAAFTPRANGTSAREIAAAPLSGTTTREREPPRRTDALRWIGTITTDGRDRFVVSITGGVTTVVEEGGEAVFGWSVLGRDGERIVVAKEGVVYEAYR